MHAPPCPLPYVYIYGTRGNFPSSERHWTNWGRRPGDDLPYHHGMDRQDEGNIYGAPSRAAGLFVIGAIAIGVAWAVLSRLL